MVAEQTETPVRRINSQADVRTLSLVRTLYLVQGHTPAEIENMGLGVTRQQVSQWAWRYDWAATKGKAKSTVEQGARAHVDASVSRVTEAIAIESEELCFKALKETRAGLDAGGLNGAKQAQAASSTLRNLAGVAKTLRDPAATADGSEPRNLNLFFVGLPGAAMPVEPKIAEKVTDIAPANQR